MARIRENNLIKQPVGRSAGATWCRAARRCLYRGVYLLITLDLIVRRYPADGDLGVASEDALVDLDCRNGEPLTRANVVRLRPLKGGGGVGDVCVASPALLSLVEPKERLVDGTSASKTSLFVLRWMRRPAQPSQPFGHPALSRLSRPCWRFCALIGPSFLSTTICPAKRWLALYCWGSTVSCRHNAGVARFWW